MPQRLMQTELAPTLDALHAQSAFEEARSELRALRFDAARLGRVVHLMRHTGTARTKTTRTNDVHGTLSTGLAPALSEAQRRGVRVFAEFEGCRGMASGSLRMLEAFVACIDEALIAGAVTLDVSARREGQTLVCQLYADVNLSQTSLGVLATGECRGEGQVRVERLYAGTRITITIPL